MSYEMEVTNSNLFLPFYRRDMLKKKKKKKKNTKHQMQSIIIHSSMFIHGILDPPNSRLPLFQK